MEDLIPFLVVIAWVVLSIVGRLAQSRQKKAKTGTAPQPAKKPSAFEQALREMMREAGLAEEAPVPAEHRPTPSEHRPTVAEHRQTAMETQATVSEHTRTASETRVTRSEHVPRASDHRPTPGEHLKGDVRLPPVPKPPPRQPTRRRSPLARTLGADLRGAKALARAFVLREVVGPPVSLRQPEEK